ncbi:MAG: hypothetical protein R3C39_15210 [Dehalococcoidia bacterium]
MSKPRLPLEPLQRGGGEQVDRAAEEAIHLAHKALDRFPDLVRRHSFIAGGAAVSSALVVLAGVAIARRMRAGETAEQALEHVTAEEIETPRSDRPRASEDEDGETSDDDDSSEDDGSETASAVAEALSSNGVSEPKAALER